MSKTLLSAVITLAVIASVAISGCGKTGVGPSPSQSEKEVGVGRFITTAANPHTAFQINIQPQSDGGQLAVRLDWTGGAPMRLCADTYLSERDMTARFVEKIQPRESGCAEGTTGLKFQLQPSYDGGYRSMLVYTTQDVADQGGVARVMLKPN